MTPLWLALIGIAEGAVYLIRYRTANQKSHWKSAWSTMLVAVLRILFVLAGASALMASETWWALVLAYAVPATGATLATHWWLERR